MIKLNIKILLNFFFLFTFATVIGQYTGPKPVVVGDAITNNYQVIYPLGWSEDGVFAYIHQDINVLGAAEVYFYTIVFQNMKTNEILWTLNIECNFENNNHYNNHYSPDNTSYNFAFFKQIVWVSYVQKIENKLKLYNIERASTSLQELVDLPKEISLKESERKEKEFTNQYYIKLVKNGKFNPVYQFDCKRAKEPCKADETIWYRNFTVKSYFKSPFENRIAILVFKTENGFEEPFEYPFFVGTHLNKGFMDIGCKQ